DHLHPGEARDALADGVADADVVGERVALAAGQVESGVEAPRTIRGDLVQAVEAVGPLAVDVDAALGARAGARALHDDVAIVVAAAQEVGGIGHFVADLAPGPV